MRSYSFWKWLNKIYGILHILCAEVCNVSCHPYIIQNCDWVHEWTKWPENANPTKRPAVLSKVFGEKPKQDNLNSRYTIWNVPKQYQRKPPSYFTVIIKMSFCSFCCFWVWYSINVEVVYLGNVDACNKIAKLLRLWIMAIFFAYLAHKQ